MGTRRKWELLSNKHPLARHSVNMAMQTCIAFDITFDENIRGGRSLRNPPLPAWWIPLREN